jgi:hypothetical protein
MKPKAKPIKLNEPPKLVNVPVPTLEPFLTVRETAALWRKSEASVRLALTLGKVKRYKVGQRTLIRLSDAQAMIREA